jgi:hypothetical protein
MPLQLADYDVSILKALMNDGFREISRETSITTPTVKARFKRLINVGFLNLSLQFLILELWKKKRLEKKKLWKKKEKKVLENEAQSKNKNQYNYNIYNTCNNNWEMPDPESKK